MGKTLGDFIKGYPRVPVLDVADYKDSKGKRYYLCKEPTGNSYYFMKGEEVIVRKYIPYDNFPKLAIARLNNKKDPEIIKEIEQCQSYQDWVKFIYQQTGEWFKF